MKDAEILQNWECCLSDNSNRVLSTTEKIPRIYVNI